MKTGLKVEKSTAPTVGRSNRYRHDRGEKSKTRPNFEGGTVNLDRISFDCSNGNHANNYSQGMRRVAKYFGRTANYGTDIQYTIMK